MIVNGPSLSSMAPIKNMLNEKRRSHGVSYGLSEAGYDICLAQTLDFTPPKMFGLVRPKIVRVGVNRELSKFTPAMAASIDTFRSRFVLASALERFTMPPNLLGVVHDKSTWARQGISVFNTVIEPGWEGYLTLEIVFNGTTPLTIPAGAGIAQILFHEVKIPVEYTGKYQNQSDGPVSAIME